MIAKLVLFVAALAAAPAMAAQPAAQADAAVHAKPSVSRAMKMKPKHRRPASPAVMGHACPMAGKAMPSMTGNAKMEKSACMPSKAKATGPGDSPADPVSIPSQTH
jgi:hypothetical protein